MDNDGAASQLRENALEEAILGKQGWSREKLETAVAEQQEKFAGLLTRQGALEIIARTGGAQLPEQPKEIAYTPLAKAGGMAGSSINAVARVWHAFAPKRFSKRDESGKERSGRVCNVFVKDGTGDATLVLWNNDVSLVEKGVIERNDCLELRGVAVKNGNSVELHSGLYSRISHADSQRAASLPKNEIKTTALSAITSSSADVDTYGRIASVGKASEFTRVKKTGAQEKGYVCSGALTDGKCTLRIVGWDENARVLEKLKIGDAVKIESGYAKPGQREGEMELHAGWQGRIVPNPKGHGLESSEKMLSGRYPRRMLSEIADGEEALLIATVAGLPSARKMKKCTLCKAKAGDSDSECPVCKSPLRELLIVRAVLDDGTKSAYCTFFDKQALDLLELGEMSMDASTALEIKRGYLVGKPVKIVAVSRKNPLREGNDLVARHVISTRPDPIAEAKELLAKMEK
ncbi:hypothetical protein HY995_05720 [Candidatus Micrarchaeota archaeon]|nr:hypothetical protein [Candidatus Micrarchaeota archaeon]MBI5177552.1 hypothetical protein [Candidatus Micrarchaeota archaeon]